jgi:hypothetical protein
MKNTPILIAHFAPIAESPRHLFPCARNIYANPHTPRCLSGKIATILAFNLPKAWFCPCCVRGGTKSQAGGTLYSEIRIEYGMVVEI